MEFDWLAMSAVTPGMMRFVIQLLAPLVRGAVAPARLRGSPVLPYSEVAQKNDARMKVFGPAAPSIFASFLFAALNLHWLGIWHLIAVPKLVPAPLVEARSNFA